MTLKTDDYKQLTPEGQQEILKGKIGQWETERFGHALDVDRFDRLLAVGLGTEQDQAQYRQLFDLAKRSVAMLDISIATATEPLAALEAKMEAERVADAAEADAAPAGD